MEEQDSLYWMGNYKPAHISIHHNIKDVPHLDGRFRVDKSLDSQNIEQRAYFQGQPLRLLLAVL